VVAEAGDPDPPRGKDHRRHPGRCVGNGCRPGGHLNGVTDSAEKPQDRRSG